VLGVPNFIPRASQIRVRPTLRFFESAIDEIIENRRQHLLDHPTDPPKDILAHLLGAADPETGARMTEAEIRSNILTFIAAGHETTANALSWSIFLLSQSSEWRQRVEAEADRELESGSPDDVSERLSETRAVIEEAIRLYPPIAAISRVSNGSDNLAGASVKRGSMVVISPYVLHRHRLLWDRPDVFDPSRFIGSARMKINRFAYLPFGAGVRTCIGSSFALQEATLVLATIMKYFNLEMAPGYLVTPLLRVTLRPAGGLPMKVSRRKAS
jgi:cytochrome P450